MEEKINKTFDATEEESFDQKLNRLSNNLLAKNVSLNNSRVYHENYKCKAFYY
jgi:hypothetical protein